MSTVTVAIGRELFEDQVIREVKKKLRKLFRKRLVVALGKRAAGVIGGLLVPEPVVSKIIAIGFGIWGVWEALSIIYEFLAMSELFENTLQKIWDSLVIPLISGPNPPSNNRLKRILECMVRCWSDALTKVGLGQALIGKSLDEITQEAFDCMADCLETP